MEVDGGFFSTITLVLAGVFYAMVLFLAIRMAPWRRLRDSEQLHVFLGACVSLLLLWHMRVSVQPGLVFHLLGVTSVTLMFGWSLAIVASTLALLGVTLNSGFGWDGFVMNAISTGVIPVTLSQMLLVLIRSLLPKHFFVYVLANAFMTAGIVALISGYLVTGLLVVSGVYSYFELSQTFLPFFPLMFLPEAILNGWIMTIMISLRPHWVSSFSDELYIKGK